MATKLKAKRSRSEASSKADEPVVPALLTPYQRRSVVTHIEKHVGKIDRVWEELACDGVHLDVAYIEPSEDRPFKTYITIGMSAAAMPLSKGYYGPKRVELFLVLPSDWPTDDESLATSDQRYWWPIASLHIFSGFPSTSDAYVDAGATVQPPDPRLTFSRTSKFVCWLLLPPMVVDQKFATLAKSRFEVDFLQICPLYQEELDLKQKKGVESLLKRFDDADLDPTRLFDPKRQNVCSRQSARTSISQKRTNR